MRKSFVVRGLTLLALTAAVSLQTIEVSAQSAKEAAASKAFYNIKGGQTVLVAADSELNTVVFHR